MLAYGANATGTTLGLSNASLGTLEAGGDISNLLISSPSTIVFGANSSERMRITSGGNVGIGTTAPTNKLTIQSNSTQLRLETSSDPTNYYSFIESNYNAANPLNIYSSAAASYAMGTIALAGIDGVNTYLNSYYGIVFGTSSTLISSGTVRMMITNGGKVGIGTTSPVYRLEVNSSTADNHIAAIGTAPSINVSSANTGPANWGTVAMATTTNHFITGAAAGDFILLNRGTTAGNMLFGFGSSEKMRLTSGGNLGIGTSAPAASLHVVGNEYVAKLGGGGTYKQTVVGQTTAAASGVSKKIAYVGYTHSIRVYVWANQSAAHGSSAIADICTLYGASSGGTVVESNFGNVTDITVTYNNGGSPAYTIDVSVTYSGTTPTINYVIEGISHDNNIYTI
jgi:hypothetical protein